MVILWSLASAAWAISFELMPIDLQISNQQSLALSFKLTDAKATQEPDFSDLMQVFDIYSQGTTSSYSLLNGSLSQATTWTLVVFPKKTGKILIPKVSVATSQGTLSTKQVEIEVIQDSQSATGASSSPQNNVSAHKSKNVYLQGSFNAHELYINQPFVYSLKIFTKVPAANMMLNDLHSDDAIIERYGEPAQYNTLIHGDQVNVTEIKYVVTPLKSGKMILNPASVRYEILNSFFNRYHTGPATAYSDEEVLKVLDTPAKAQPFSKLTLVDLWDISNDKEIRENDSITRTIKIIGEDGHVDGLVVNLPSQAEHYNLYQDKTKESKTVTKDDHVHSEKIINYTIIPIKSGEMVIPKTIIKWWNVNKRQLETLEIPEKKFTVLADNKGSPTRQDNLAQDESNLVMPTYYSNKYKAFFSASILLNIVFILLHLVKWRLKFKKPKPKIILEDITSVDQLKDYINQFVADAWKIKGNLPLKDLWNELSKANFTYDQGLAKELTNKLNSNLYFKEELQVSKAIDLWRKFSVTVAKKASSKEQESQKNKLNPI